MDSVQNEFCSIIMICDLEKRAAYNKHFFSVLKRKGKEHMYA